MSATIYALSQRRRPDGIVGLFHYGMSKAAQQRRVAEMLAAGVPPSLVAVITRRSAASVLATLQDER